MSKDLHNFIIYRCIVGSRAYGLETDQSDTDRRGIYLPPANLHWSLTGVPEQFENSATQEVYWELQKFLTLALKSNPTILECLYTPLVEHASPVAQELLAMREDSAKVCRGRHEHRAGKQQYASEKASFATANIQLRTHRGDNNQRAGRRP